MTCRTCAVEFIPSDIRGLARYCSALCRGKANSQRAIRNYHCRASTLRFICKHCGAAYTPKNANRNQFCGRQCARLAQGFDLSKPSNHRPHCRVYFPNCEQCRKQFTTNRKTVRLCSDVCRKARQEEACLYPRTCKVCQCEFTRKWAHDVCSDACQEIINKPKRRVASKATRKKRRALGLDDHGKAYKRAKRCGVAYEVIQRRKVYERDGWMCLLCRKPIKQGVVVPHPLSATLDHIIPMSKGGSHTYSNVQCAHFSCNWMKGDKSQGEQLLLVG